MLLDLGALLRLEPPGARNIAVPHDGSSLVTSGRGQPTMTIQALAFCAGKYIAQFAKREEIQGVALVCGMARS